MDQAAAIEGGKCNGFSRIPEPIAPPIRAGCWHNLRFDPEFRQCIDLSRQAPVL
jgi:hypothetical protein